MLLFATASLAFAPPAPPIIVNVDLDSAPTHTINPNYLGCHTDLGFTHQGRSFSSQMIFGESFEQPQKNASTRGESSNSWYFEPCAGCNATSVVETATVAPAKHGASSRNLTMSHVGHTSPSVAKLINRGLGSEGLYLQAGKPYEGYAFARCDPTAGKLTLVARLETYAPAVSAPKVLAEQSIPFACGKTSEEWVQLPFELTPSESAQCEGIEVGSDPNVHCTGPTNEAGHACVRCAGQFAIGLASAGSVSLDYIVLQPGRWGRVGNLPVKRSMADALLHMGISGIRIGGSFASVTNWPDGGGGTPPSTRSGAYYRWQDWTGPPWLRPSVGAVWNGYYGSSYTLIGGWGPFEAIDMCSALGIEPIITTTSSSSPSDLADLVEYCLGDVSTPMGGKRNADGHPAPYRLRYLELGNEQYNTMFVQQVAAMEERARALGHNGTLRYIFPDNAGLRGKDVDAAIKLGIDAQIAADIHVGPGGGVESEHFRIRTRSPCCSCR